MKYFPVSAIRAAATSQSEILAVPISTSGLSVGSVTYSSYVSADVYYLDLEHDFVVPRSKIPPEGLDVEVLDRDAKSPTDELIGRFRLASKDIRVGKTFQLAEVDVQQLELKVKAAPTEPTARVLELPATNGLTFIEGLRVPAGAAVRIEASGHYRIGSWNDTTIDPDGYPRGGPRKYNLPSFPQEPHGAAVSLLSRSGSLQVAAVGACQSSTAAVGGALLVGLNDKDPGNNEGLVVFTITVSMPTLEEWEEPGSRRDCPPPSASAPGLNSL